MNQNTCIVCGVVIPEGRQVCPKCDRSHRQSTKTNRDRFMEMSLYDALLAMQKNLDPRFGNDERYPCIMVALGENLAGLRCTKHNGKCDECIQAWLNETAGKDEKHGKTD